MPLPGSEGQPPHRIQEMWVWVALDPDDGDEGVVSFFDPSQRQHMPLIGSDKTRRDMLIGLASMVHAQTGQRMELRRFTFASVEQVLE